MEMVPIKIKCFSLERSGSNFLIRTLIDNFVEFTSEKIIREPWKHSIPPHNLSNYAQNYDNPLTKSLNSDEDVLFVLPVKSPYKFVISYFRGWAKGHLMKSHYKNHANDILSQHIDIMPPTMNNRDFFTSLIEKYNIFCYSALTLNKGYELSYIVNYDDLLNDLAEIFDYFQSKFDLTPTHDNWQIQDNEVITGQQVKNKEYDTSFWTDGEYWDYIGDWHKDYIDENVLWTVTKELGVVKE